MPPTIWEFWRDEAKLDFLSPQQRYKFYAKQVLTIFPSLAGIAAVAVCIMSADPVLIGGIIAMMVYPCALILEMFWKGGEAGTRLMNELSTIKSTTTASEAYSYLRWMVDWLRSEAKRFPATPDTRDNGFQKKFAKEMYEGLLFCGQLPWSVTHYQGRDTLACRNAIQEAANLFDRESVKMSRFNERWRPSEELLKLMTDNPRPSV